MYVLVNCWHQLSYGGACYCCSINGATVAVELLQVRVSPFILEELTRSKLCSQSSLQNVSVQQDLHGYPAGPKPNIHRTGRVEGWYNSTGIIIP